MRSANSTAPHNSLRTLTLCPLIAAITGAPFKQQSPAKVLYTLCTQCVPFLIISGLVGIPVPVPGHERGNGLRRPQRQWRLDSLRNADSSASTMCNSEVPGLWWFGMQSRGCGQALGYRRKAAADD